MNTNKGTPFRHASKMQYNEKTNTLTYYHATKGWMKRKVNDILLDQLFYLGMVNKSQ